MVRICFFTLYLALWCSQILSVTLFAFQLTLVRSAAVMAVVMAVLVAGVAPAYTCGTEAPSLKWALKDAYVRTTGIQDHVRQVFIKVL